MKNLKFSFVVILFGLILPNWVFAQYRLDYVPLYNYKEEAEPINELLDMFNEDYTYENPISTLYDTLILNTNHYKREDIPMFGSDVITNRLRSVPSIISLDYNQYVQRYIDVYTLEKRDRVAKMLGLTNAYFPLFEAELDKRGMPIELKYLTIVESALNPHAKSRAGATGLWQFMLGTAQEYGLKIDSYVDERRDPHKSTIAALNYLQKAYELFGDWQLAIASYNCGAGNVRKAINRAGGVKNFWAIREYLPAETRGYVPAYIAAVYTFNYYAEHNIYPINTDFTLNQDTLHIKNMNISLYDIAQLTGVDINALQNLNPELKLGLIPYSSYDTYILRVPSKVADYFSQYPTYIADKFGQKYYASSSYNTTTTYYPSTTTTTTSSTTSYASTPANYNVNASSNTQSANGNPEGTIAIGSSFLVENSPTESESDIQRYTSKSTTSATKTNTVAAKTTTSPAKKTEVHKEPAKSHTIRKGDTLSEIAAKYDISVEHLRKLNPGVSTKRLEIGDKMRVK